MALIEAKKDIVVPSIDPRLKAHVLVVATCDIPAEIANLFSCCVNAVADQMENDGLLVDTDHLLFVTCIFTDKDTISITLEPNELAIVTPIIVYPFYKWNINHPEIVCSSMIEELAHFFWGIRSEYEVSLKVLTILNRIYTNLKLEDIFNVDILREIDCLERKKFIEDFLD
ncbi:MAG: hypothetical protein J1F63_00245 [Oscillospiraceae bacterium]|nr:hypothetical protein [Oscillospiraceae bacterium]